MTDIASIFDQFTIAEITPEWLENVRLFLDHLEEQAHAASAARADKATQVAADVSSDFLHCVYDQRSHVERPKRKWYTTNTKVGDRLGPSRLTLKRGLCFHHTAVKHGFGADRAKIKEYTKLVASGVDMSMFARANRLLTQDEAARALALACRYRGEPAREYNMGVPYHAIMAANSVLYLNLPFTWVTWHGNGSNNDFIGVAWDADSTDESCANTADDLIADVETLVRAARDEGHPIEEFTVHCAWTNKRHDPGAEFIALVLEPAAAAFACKLDYDFKAKVSGARSIREVLDAA